MKWAGQVHAHRTSFGKDALCIIGGIHVVVVGNLNCVL